MRMRWVCSGLPALLTTVLVSVVVVLWGASLAEARITRIQINRVESPTFGGASFGDVGQYEKLVGRAFGEIDPTDPRNAVIADIGLAPINARGKVEYSTDIYILRPMNSSRGNHRLFFEINNRGFNLSFGQFNNATTGRNDPTAAAAAGNGFLMRQGYTIAWSGWDATAVPGGGRFTITVPVAKNPDGSPIVGPALEEFVIDDNTTMTGDLTYPAATLDKSQASLTVRVRYQDPPTPVPAANWEYVNASTIRLLPVGTPFQAGTIGIASPRLETTALKPARSHPGGILFSSSRKSRNASLTSSLSGRPGTTTLSRWPSATYSGWSSMLYRPGSLRPTGTVVLAVQVDRKLLL